jgi:cytochrome c oxidase subunit 1
MTTIAFDGAGAAAPSSAPTRPSYIDVETTITSWLLTTDHKRIGVLYLVTVSAMLFLGGTFAILLRLEHLTPGPTLMSATTYNRLFSLHGITMVWLFMIPSIPTTFGNFLLPIMVGAKDVAFPRLNLASYYIYAAGCAVVIATMLWGGIDTGWTFYQPYTAHSPSAVVPTVIGIFILGWSSIITGVNFIATMHTMRARGLTWMRLPLFAWAMYGTSIIQVLATPVLALALLLIAIDHGFGWGLFDPSRGGDPVLFQHLFWFYSHPAVYIMILPAMGVISEVIPTYAHKNPFSYGAIVYSTLGIAFVGFLTWGHHMFVAGISKFDAGAFGILSMLVAIFSAIKVYAWTGTLYRGSIVVRTPLIYAFAFLFLFVFGGMTGVAVASMSLDVHWHDTYFVVAHFHFIMAGGTLMAFLAALHYWWPKVTGRLYDERAALIAAFMTFLGFFLTFFPQFLLGNAGMPRRYYEYPAEFQSLHVISTVGSWATFLGLAIALANLVQALVAGAPAGPNPWDSRSFEWRTPSPPPKTNFDRPPEFSTGAYDYHLPLPVEGDLEGSHG